MKFNNITPNDGYEYFFGYYDLQPYDADMRFHLAHRVKFRDRHPSADDVAEVGYINLSNKTFVKLAETRSWNFQQGALLIWFESGKSILFNDFDGERNISRVVDISGNEIRRFNLPLGAVNKTRTKGLSINFNRILDFRKGYGYSNVKDVNFDVFAPDNDGIFAVDLITGKTELILSYSKMKEVFSEQPFTSQKLVVNHITFNPSGNEFVFLLRNFPQAGSKWGTVLAVGDLCGNVKKLTNFQVNSHYSYKDDKTLAIWSGLPEYGVYVFNTDNCARYKIENRVINHGDIHVNFSNDGNYFIGDGYVEENQSRYVYKYDMNTGIAERLFGVYSEPVSDTDIRCDLHARISPDGKRISYDTTQNNKREIFEYYL